MTNVRKRDQQWYDLGYREGGANRYELGQCTHDEVAELAAEYAISEARGPVQRDMIAQGYIAGWINARYRKNDTQVTRK